MVHAHTAVKPVAETVVAAGGTGTVVARLGLDFVVSRLRYGVGCVDLVAKESIVQVGSRRGTGGGRKRRSS